MFVGEEDDNNVVAISENLINNYFSIYNLLDP